MHRTVVALAAVAPTGAIASSGASYSNRGVLCGPEVRVPDRRPLVRYPCNLIDAGLRPPRPILARRGQYFGGESKLRADQKGNLSRRGRPVRARGACIGPVTGSAGVIVRPG